MLKNIKEPILTDLKIIFSNYRFLIALLIIVWLSFLHSLLFPVFSDYLYKNSGLRLEEYYALFTLTCISIVPILIGTLYGKIVATDAGSAQDITGNKSSEDNETLLYARLGTSVVLSFLILIISVIIIRPVHSQGWLRNLSAAMLLSLQSVVVFLVVVTSWQSRPGKIFFILITTLLLLALPLGMLFHHPWNYLAFFSPFYWIGWEWLIVSPSESMIFGAIVLVISSAASFFLFKKYSGKISGK